MTGPYIKDKHDIGLLRSDGTTKVGLMLVQDPKTGTPRHQEFDDEYLAQQFFTGVPGYGSLPAEKEIAIRQDDWRSGFGLETYDSADPKRYYSSIGMDMRFKGMAMAGPTSTAIDPTADFVMASAITNWNMETAASGWTNGARDGTQKHHGTYSWLVNNTEAYQDLVWDASYQSKVFYIKIWVWAADASNARIGINDGVSATTYHAYHAGNSAWAVQEVSHTLNAGATRLRIVLASDTANACYFDCAASIQSGYPVDFYDFYGVLCIAWGSTLFGLNAAGSGLDYIECFPQVITGLGFMSGALAYLLVGQGAGHVWNYVYWNFVVYESNGYANYFKEVNATTVWKVRLNNSIYSVASGTGAFVDANWSGATTVAGTDYDITDLLEYDGSLYIMKEDRPFYLSSGAVKTLTNAPRSMASATGGKNVVEWNGKIYMPYGTQGFLEYDSGTLTWRNPSNYCTNLSSFTGRVQALAGDDAFLYAIVDNSANVEVLAGRFEDIEGTSTWVWHPIHEVALTNCNKAFISSIYKKRLYIASDTAGEGLYFIDLPTGYGDITNDTNFTAKTDGYMITPWLHGNFRETDKAFIKITAHLGHTYDADIYFECHFEEWGDAAYTDAGDLIGSATDRDPELFFTANTPTSTAFRLKFVAKTDVATKTPILNGYSVQAILYPPTRNIIACVVKSDNERVLRDGLIDKGSTANDGTVLDEARAATWPVTFYDIDGTTRYVKFLPLPAGTPRKVLIRSEKGRVNEWHYNLLLQEVTLS